MRSLRFGDLQTVYGNGDRDKHLHRAKTPCTKKASMSSEKSNGDPKQLVTIGVLDYDAAKKFPKPRPA